MKQDEEKTRLKARRATPPTGPGGIDDGVMGHHKDVIDTEGNPTEDDFKDLATNCDLMVVPAVPESVASSPISRLISATSFICGSKTEIAPAASLFWAKPST